MRVRLVCSAALAAVCLFPSSVAERTGKVEVGLMPRIRVEGEPPVRWSLPVRQSFYKVPGLSVAVIDQGKIQWAKGYGDGITPTTRFQAASISKPVAAVTALRLAQRGLLSLDEDVNKKLKSWKVPDNQWGRPVTLRQLLSHTAGLTVSGFPGYAKSAAMPTLVQVLKGEKPANTKAVLVDAEPGSMYRYSGGGYEVLQLLIEDVTEKPFAAVVRSLVLDPAGMKDSGYDAPAPGHLALAHNGKGEPVTGGWHSYPEQAAAGLWTTPSDLARFLLAVNTSKLLPQALTNEMLTPVKNNYALGFEVEGAGVAESFGHSGVNMGYRCTATLYRNSVRGVVVMTSGDNGSALGGEFVRAVAEEYGWPSKRALAIKVATLSDAAMAAMAGEYSSGDLKVQITPSRRSLKVAAVGQVLEFVPETEVRFLSLSEGPPTLEVEKDSAGTVLAVTVAGRRLKKQ